MFHTIITLFRFITMFCGTKNIYLECGEYPKILREILSVPQNIVMDLNNVMKCHTIKVYQESGLFQCAMSFCIYSQST